MRKRRAGEEAGGGGEEGEGGGGRRESKRPLVAGEGKRERREEKETRPSKCPYLPSTVKIWAFSNDPTLERSTFEMDLDLETNQLIKSVKRTLHFLSPSDPAWLSPSTLALRTRAILLGSFTADRISVLENQAVVFRDENVLQFNPPDFGLAFNLTGHKSNMTQMLEWPINVTVFGNSIFIGSLLEDFKRAQRVQFDIISTDEPVFDVSHMRISSTPLQAGIHVVLISGILMKAPGIISTPALEPLAHDKRTAIFIADFSRPGAPMHIFRFPPGVIPDNHAVHVLHSGRRVSYFTLNLRRPRDGNFVLGYDLQTRNCFFWNLEGQTRVALDAQPAPDILKYHVSKLNATSMIFGSVSPEGTLSIQPATFDEDDVLQSAHLGVARIAPVKFPARKDPQLDFGIFWYAADNVVVVSNKFLSAISPVCQILVASPLLEFRKLPMSEVYHRHELRLRLVSTVRDLSSMFRSVCDRLLMAFPTGVTIFFPEGTYTRVSLPEEVYPTDAIVLDPRPLLWDVEHAPALAFDEQSVWEYCEEAKDETSALCRAAQEWKLDATCTPREAAEVPHEDLIGDFAPIPPTLRFRVRMATSDRKPGTTKIECYNLQTLKELWARMQADGQTRLLSPLSRVPFSEYQLKRLNDAKYEPSPGKEASLEEELGAAVSDRARTRVAYARVVHAAKHLKFFREGAHLPEENPAKTTEMLSRARYGDDQSWILYAYSVEGYRDVPPDKITDNSRFQPLSPAEVAAEAAAAQEVANLAEAGAAAVAEGEEAEEGE